MLKSFATLLIVVAGLALGAALLAHGIGRPAPAVARVPPRPGDCPCVDCPCGAGCACEAPRIRPVSRTADSLIVIPAAAIPDYDGPADAAPPAAPPAPDMEDGCMPGGPEPAQAEESLPGI